MTELKIDELTTQATKLAKDAVYITVGFGVLAAQKLNVQRLEMTKSLEANLESGLAGSKTQADKVATTLQSQLEQLEHRLVTVEDRIEGLLDQAQSFLPTQMSDAVTQARESAKAARAQVRSMVKVA